VLTLVNRGEKYIRTFQANPSLLNAEHLIQSCLELKDLQSALSIYKILGSHSIPNTGIFYGLIKSCRALGYLQPVLSLWWDQRKVFQRAPSRSIVVNTLVVCAILGTKEALAVGKDIHAYLWTSHRIPIDIVMYTTLLNMFTKCKQPQEALNLWNDMCNRGVDADRVTMICVLSACADIGEKGLGLGA